MFEKLSCTEGRPLLKCPKIVLRLCTIHSTAKVNCHTYPSVMTQNKALEWQAREEINKRELELSPGPFGLVPNERTT